MINECTIIDKKFRSGGQKDVALASHPNHGIVVIKVGKITSSSSLERIKREVGLLKKLSSKFYPKQFYFNIDLVQSEFQIIEEYIQGQTLEEKLDAGEFYDVNQIFTLLYHLVSGLSIIWKKRIVHRDLKPANIIIRPDGEPCIIDLGIARFLEMDKLTKSIALMGPCTPIYASPEQLANKKDLIDLRTDFFALGIIALHLYLRCHPFDPTVLGGQNSILENINEVRYFTETTLIKPNSDIIDFANKTLQIHPYNRFRSAKIILSFLEKKL